ncbi:hypothetical protein BC628DRAFT_794748 [Trametes gibbosa]|nr:hypothetical protein BC628DRAFT_794748 [Trametes gibbosa]
MRPRTKVGVVRYEHGRRIPSERYRRRIWRSNGRGGYGVWRGWSGSADGHDSTFNVQPCSALVLVGGGVKTYAVRVIPTQEVRTHNGWASAVPTDMQKGWIWPAGVRRSRGKMEKDATRTSRLGRCRSLQCLITPALASRVEHKSTRDESQSRAAMPVSRMGIVAATTIVGESVRTAQHKIEKGSTLPPFPAPTRRAACCRRIRGLPALHS